jgi:two-component system OmpR family sensor kinase
MTLRLRLTIFYTILLGITLIAFSAAVFLLLQNSLMREVDSVLLSSASEVENQILANATERTLPGVSILTFDASPIREFKTPGIYIQILDVQAHIVAQSANLSGEIMPLNPDLLQAALAGESTLTTTNPGRPAEPLRVLTKPLIVTGSIRGIVQVGVSLYNVRLTMRWMLLLLTLGVVGTMLIVAAVIWMLTRRALRPLEAIANTAQYIGSSQDLSQQLQIKAPNDEVGRLARAFNTMIRRLDASFSAQKQFIADSSHELRTPLTVIRGNLDLIKRDPRPANRSECLAAIDQESQRMGKIVDDLMLLAQLDAAQPPQCRTVALDEVVMQVYNQTRVLASDKRVLLGHINAVQVLADHDRLVQMLLNLVENAIKYTPAGGVITIECESPDNARYEGLAVLSVRDTGIGIAPEHLPHLFDRFYRVDKGRSREQGGTGLGLAIVKSIAETYGGRVVVESVLGQGSVFRVLLPALG